MTERDALHRFLIERTNVRGEWVHLDASWRALLERVDYPPIVRNLLGQALAAVALLAATIKFDGSLTLQLNGDGPLHLMVVQATGQRTVRGLAHWRDEVPEGRLEQQFGQGRLAITIDPGAGSERYQGIVEIAGENMAELITTYFERSEQLPTRLWLTADERTAAGLLLQALPSETRDPDAWNRAVMLADTLEDQELLTLDAPVVLHRLYHEEDVRMFDREPVAFRCGCSRERVAEVLRAMGPEESASLLEEQGSIEVDCEFCGAHYHFDHVDVEALFTERPVLPGSRTEH